MQTQGVALGNIVLAASRRKSDASHQAGATVERSSAVLCKGRRGLRRLAAVPRAVTADEVRRAAHGVYRISVRRSNHPPGRLRRNLTAERGKVGGRRRGILVGTIDPVARPKRIAGIVYLPRNDDRIVTVTSRDRQGAVWRNEYRLLTRAARRMIRSNVNQNQLERTP